MSGRSKLPLCSQVWRLTKPLTFYRFMQQWFPVEVKLKQKVNEADLAKQQMKEMGLDNSCCVQ